MIGHETVNTHSEYKKGLEYYRFITPVVILASKVNYAVFTVNCRTSAESYVQSLVR
jgi:hypothetical protein